MGLIFRILGALILVLVVVVVMVVGLLVFLPAEQYAEIAEQRLEAATGRDVRIEGEVRLTLWPELGFRTGPVAIANAPWSGSEVMFRAQGLAVGVDPRTVFGGDLRITGMEATGPEILFEIAEDGRNNWDFGGDASAEGVAVAGLPGSEPRTFTLEEAAISDGQIVVVDHGAGSRVELSGLNLRLTIPDLRGIADVEMSAELNGRAFSVAGTIRDIAALAGRQVVPVRIDATVAGGRFALDGMAGFGPLRMDGGLDADITDLSSVLKIAGIKMLPLPDPFAREMSLTGKVTLDDAGTVLVRDGTMTLRPGADDARIDVTGISADMHPPGPDGSAALAFTARMNGQEVSLTGTAGIAADIAGGQPVPLTFDLAIAGNSAQLDGSAGWGPLGVDGRFEMRIGDVEALESVSGIELDDLRQVIGERAQISGNMAYSDQDGLELAGLVIGYDGPPGTTRRQFADVDLRLRLPDADGRTGFELRLPANGRHLQASGNFGGLAGGKVPVVADIAAAGNRARLEIDVGLAPLTVNGKIRAGIADLASLLAMAGQEAPGLSGLPGGQLALEGRISLTETGLLMLEDGLIALGKDPEPAKLTKVSFSLLLPESDGMAGVELVAMLNGEALTIGGSASDLGALIDRSGTGVSLHAALGDNRISLEGEASLAPLTVRGDLKADIGDAATIFATLGRKAPALLEDGITASGQFLIDATGRLALGGGLFRFGDNVIRGDVVLEPGKRSSLTAILVGDTLDLAAYGADDRVTDDTGHGRGSGWSDDLIDVHWLQAIDARIVLSLGKLVLDGVDATSVRTTTLLDSGRAVTEIDQLSIFGGSVGGEFVVNSRGGLSVRANLQGQNLDIGRILAALADYHRLAARGDLEFSLLGVGNSEVEIMNSLSGQVAMRLGPGRVRGLDVEAILRDLDLGSLGEGRQTEFDRVEASMAVNGGVATGDDLVLAAPNLLVSGDGHIGLGARTIDYRVLTSLLDENSQTERSVPLTIRGSWADPKVRLDVAGIIERDLLSRLPEVEDRAREAVERKIAEEVGSAIGKVEEQIEDALVEELKDRVGESLLNFLGSGN